MQTVEWQRNGFTISTDQARLDLDAICGYLSGRSYWAQNRPRSIIETSIQNSLCFGVYNGVNQVGFGRLVTDYAVFAYLCDIFILESYRGQGLGKWLVESMVAHPDLQIVRRWMLATRDAHGLYEQFGFERLPTPNNIMSMRRPGV